MAQWRVSFTVYNDTDHTSSDSNLSNLTQVVEAFQPQQAQAMVEAQYGGRAHVWSVFPE